MKDCFVILHFKSADVRFVMVIKIICVMPAKMVTYSKKL